MRLCGCVTEKNVSLFFCFSGSNWKLLDWKPGVCCWSHPISEDSYQLYPPGEWVDVSIELQRADGGEEFCFAPFTSGLSPFADLFPRFPIYLPRSGNRIHTHSVFALCFWFLQRWFKIFSLFAANHSLCVAFLHRKFSFQLLHYLSTRNAAASCNANKPIKATTTTKLFHNLGSNQ